MTIMRKEELSLLTFLLLTLFLAGCQDTPEDKAKLEDAQVDLEQIADQIIITYPANNAVITDSTIIVRADIPAAAMAQEVTLFVDGVEVAKDSDGAPWELDWPTYYWADGGQHTLLLKTITGGGNEIRNNLQHQVTVDTAANKDLKFSAGVDGTQLKDLDSLLVSFDSFPSAINYDLNYLFPGLNEIISTNTTDIELTDLDLGTYELRYRAVFQYPDQTILAGPWSESVIFDVLPPDTPVTNQPVITETLSGYELTFSWEDMGVGNLYEIYLKNLSDNTQPTIVESTTVNSLLIAGLNIGKYEWQLKRTNSLGQESLLTIPQPLDIGVFTKRFGGSSDDRAKQIISSKSGGYIILGLTKSFEVSSAVDSQGDDWIFKVSEQGEIIWQYISNASGRDRFVDVIELSDGSVIAAGMDWASDQAVVLKLDSSGNKVWEVLYIPINITARYAFLDAVEFNNLLYVTSAEWGVIAGGGTAARNYYLHTISTIDGSVSDPVNIPQISGITTPTVSELEVTSDGRLLVAGTAMPENSNPDDFWLAGAYLLALDSMLAPTMEWNNVGKNLHTNVGDVIELSNTRFAVIGQHVFGGSLTISVVNNDGTEFKSYAGLFDQEFYGGGAIAAGDNGEFYGLFQDSSVYAYPRPLTFMSFNSDLVVDQQSYLLEFKDYVNSSAGLVKNDDGTFTLLFSEAQNGSNNYDIVLDKRVIN